MAPRKQFLIWGGGGHGKVVADLVRAVGAEVFGYVDADPDKLGNIVEPGGSRVVLVEDEFLDRLHHDGLPDGIDAVALAIGENGKRASSRDTLCPAWLPTLVHPSAIISPSARIGCATVVFPRAVVNASAVIGEAVIVNSGTIIEHDCAIGDAAHISPGAVLTGGVAVGPKAWIGAGAVVLPGVTIGARAIVGAGAVVRKDVPEAATVAGVPARHIR